MANFCRLTSISLTHNYFADGFCRGLEFVPTPVTKKLLDRNELIIKPSDAGFWIIGDQDAPSLLDDNLVLRFYAQVKDPYFSFYTANAPKDGALFFSTQQRVQNQLLASTSCAVSPQHDEEMASGRINSQFYIDICLAADALKNFTDTEHFSVDFQARALHWKYYFFGDLANYELEIQDLAAQSPILFTNSNAPVVKNGKALLSQSPIMLSEAPKQRFQLKDKSNSGKVLVKRLPNAGVNRIGKERNPDGQSFLVAEIYINQ